MSAKRWQVDEAQLRGAVRALRAMHEEQDGARGWQAAAGVSAERAGAVPMGTARPAGQRRTIAQFWLSLALVCLASLGSVSSEGRLASILKPVVSFRRAAGGPSSSPSGPVGPEKAEMSMERTVRGSILAWMTLIGVGSGAAWAGDASFLPSDSISVQGYTNNPSDTTIECRVWIPSGSAPILSGSSPAGLLAGTVFHEQANSREEQNLSVGPDGISVSLVPVAIANFPTDMPKNQWCHVAVVRRGASLRGFVNGQQIGAITCASGPIAVINAPDLRIGAPVHNGGGCPNFGFMGRIDWIRVSSVARYTDNFTVPSEDSLVPADAATELLFRFNDRPGSLLAIEESPHRFANVVGDARSFPAGTVTSPRFSGFGCPSDLDGDGEVNGSDISLLLLDFGACP